MPPSDPQPLAPGLALTEADLSVAFSRCGGPGGQNVNKLNTQATLSVPLERLREVMPGWAFERLPIVAGRYLGSEHLVIQASEHRGQRANRRAAVQRLRTVLIEAMHRPRKRRPTGPTKASVRRRLDAKTHRGRLKNDRSNPPPHGAP